MTTSWHGDSFGRSLMESIELLTRWFDRDDQDFPRWVPVDMLLGAGPSVPYRSEADLAAIRDEARAMALVHPFALSAIENRVSYVVGSGHTYKVRRKPAQDLSPEAIEAIERELVEWQEANEWFSRQQQPRVVTVSRTMRCWSLGR